MLRMNSQKKVKDSSTWLLTILGLEFLQPTATMEMKSNWETKDAKVVSCNEFTKEEIELAAARELLPWKRIPHSLNELFYYPNPINEVDSQVFCALMFMETIVALVLIEYKNWPYLYILLIYACAAKALFGPFLEPQVNNWSASDNSDMVCSISGKEIEYWTALCSRSSKTIGNDL